MQTVANSRGVGVKNHKKMPTLNGCYQDYMSYQPGLIILEINKTNQGRSILGRSAKTKCGPKAGITLVKTVDVRDGCKINKSAGQFLAKF